LYGRLRLGAKHVVQRLLASLARRNLYLAAGPNHTSNRVDLSRMELSVSQTVDFVRFSTLDLLAREIEMGNVNGAVAELGVFQGYTAAVLARRFPTRDLFLFDTFRGFDDRDLAAEESLGIKTSNRDRFENTSLEFVLRLMPDGARVHPVVGWFPESAQTLPDSLQFCLVSLDADLYDPMHAGLDWFYRRLSPGGYMLVHDVNNSDHPGARRAVEDFGRTQGIGFCSFQYAISFCTSLVTSVVPCW